MLIEDLGSVIRVSSDTWEIEHLRTSGGVWSAVRFATGSRENLIRHPAGAAIRFVRPDPQAESGIFSDYCEHLDRNARLIHEQMPDGNAMVTAEGTFTDEHGRSIPVGFRRRTEYSPNAPIWTTLEIMSDCGCDGVVELRAFELALRPGLKRASVRFHPTQAGGPDLLGGRADYDLTRTGDVPFMSRFTPIELAVEGIKVFPASDLAAWDCGIKPDMGIGLYTIRHSTDGMTLQMSPYCMALRRVGARVQGHITYRLGISFSPEQKKDSESHIAAINSDWPSESTIKDLVQKGISIIRLDNGYRENGPFWRAGSWPPYDETNMSELRRVIDAAHRHGLKVIPSVSIKEFHPETTEFAARSHQWMHMPAPSLGIIHNYAGGGEFGAFMCLKSGWREFIKHHVERILNGLPWDGLYLHMASPTPCCHPGHSSALWHTDQEELQDFLAYCRRQVGHRLLIVKE